MNLTSTALPSARLIKQPSLILLDAMNALQVSLDLPQLMLDAGPEDGYWDGIDFQIDSIRPRPAIDS
jgi:hypothetical protein